MDHSGDDTHDEALPTRLLSASGEHTRADSHGPTLALSSAVEGLIEHCSDGQSRVGRYIVLRVLGRGGMGVVLSAYDEKGDSPADPVDFV